jgi:hypothetical protein
VRIGVPATGPAPGPAARRPGRDTVEIVARRDGPDADPRRDFRP